jgi:hypothetical protein
MMASSAESEAPQPAVAGESNYPAMSCRGGPNSRHQADSGAEDKPQLLDSAKEASSTIAEISPGSHSNDNESKESTKGKSEEQSYPAPETVAPASHDVESTEAPPETSLQNDNSTSLGAPLSQTPSIAALSVCVPIILKEISLTIVRWTARSC